MQHLKDATTYQKVNFDIDMKMLKKMKKHLNKYKKCFTKPEKEFLNKNFRNH